MTIKEADIPFQLDISTIDGVELPERKSIIRVKEYQTNVSIKAWGLALYVFIEGESFNTVMCTDLEKPLLGHWEVSDEIEYIKICADALVKGILYPVSVENYPKFATFEECMAGSMGYFKR